MAKKKDSKESEELDIEKAFEEEIKKPYYKVDYLDNFKLPYDRLDVSVVIPTYNRCPYKPNSLKRELNPLAWAIQSLLLQKPSINEIIIVDDHSDDYTKQVVEFFKESSKEKGIKLVYVRNKTKQGNSISRHVGSISANSKYITFLDDDAIIPPYAIFGAFYTFEKLEETGVNVGMINMPTYFRSTKPSKIVSKKNIGRVDFIKGLYTTNKDAFPLEYLEEKEKFLDVELHILNPFLINNMNSTFTLCSKKCYQEIGGFKSNVIGRGLDREFGLEAIENGYLIYFQPDPKFHCVHGAYGLESKNEFVGEDWFRKVGGSISLKKAMNTCNKINRNTGMRISADDYFYHAILSIFTLIYPRNKKGALNWIEKVYSEFVKKGESKIFGGIDISVPNESERKGMWEKAIKEGINFIRTREMIEIKKVSAVARKIKNQGEVSKEILNLLFERE